MDLTDQVAGIGALADPTRWTLYEYVVRQSDPVGREQVAAAVGIAQHNVNFHLDRLVDEGLLEVEFRRLSGRTGPGAGRPSKLYKRSLREFTVSLPPRRYDLVGDILAAGVTRAADSGDISAELSKVAHAEGAHVGQAARGLVSSDDLAAVAVVLSSQGFEPATRDGVLELTNCPFDTLARKHTALVCGLSRDFVDGVAAGLGCVGLTACLEPEPGQCCVKVRRATRSD